MPLRNLVAYNLTASARLDTGVGTE